jgi:RHS repeat-associated protein
VYSSNTLKEKYFRGSSVDELVAGYLTDTDAKLKPFLYHHDQVNSVSAVSGHNGGTIQKVTYSAFGGNLSETGTSPNRLQYTGRENDNTGLYYYRARYYDPEIGRFISEDPLGFGAGDVNFYVYVGNNPVNFNDPSGKIAPAVIAAGFLATKVTALAASWGGIQAATHIPGFVGNAASTLGYNDVGQQMSSAFSDPTKLGNQIWAGALEANRVQLQTALEFSRLDPYVDALSVAIGKDLTGIHINNQGKFVVPNMETSDRQVTGFLVGGELGFKGLGSLLGDKSLSQVGNNFGYIEAGASIFGAIQGTSFTRAWDSSSFNSSSASGGFVLYPNKPNNNMMQAVYKK